MFIGEYSANIDEKGRVAIPVKFRMDLKRQVVVTKGLDNSLFLYTRDEWEKLAEKLSTLPIAQANTRAFSRLMLAGAMELDVDKQGRVTLPQFHQQFAKLSKKVVFAGLYNRIEIWSEDEWNKYKAQVEDESNNIAEQLGGIGV
ncbi:MAG TPA: division/cell wall cluster transcriptional repressor MraZ [Patescibacteria group bacterium]|nr:division/cell wall cluster transcriptional repressor MraZ [Patescibacteria group bacterium]